MNFLAVRLLLGLLYFESFQPQVSAQGAVYCNAMEVPKGYIVTTRTLQQGDGYKSWCGLQNGKFFAVEENMLFYLQCPSGALTPRDARASILNMQNETSGIQIFGENEICDVTAGSITTGKKAKALANRLEGTMVPYDRKNCNAEHYIQYLSRGKVTTATVMRTCPVFKMFNSNTDVSSANFLLKGRTYYYNWSTVPHAGSLTLSGHTRQPSNNSRGGKKSYGRSNSSFGFGSPTQKSTTSRNAVRITGKRGGGAAAGGHGGGGGHGTGAGGRGSGEGSSGEGARGSVPYAVHGGGAHHASAASRVSSPFGGLLSNMHMPKINFLNSPRTYRLPWQN